jgi:hypothetical protein
MGFYFITATRKARMKNFLILSLLALAATGCNTPDTRSPYTGMTGEMGAYGFTYDLNAQPTPFTDTGYRPLTPFDLAAPTIIVVTNSAPPKIIYENGPEIGATHYAGSTPAIAAAPQNNYITEPSGANRNSAPAAPAGGYPYGAAPGYGAPGFVFSGPGTDLNATNTNVTATATNILGLTNFANVAQTNINGTNFLVFNGTNLVAFGGTNFTFNGTNFALNGTNFSFNGTNFAFNGMTFVPITNGFNEAAGSQLTNSPFNPANRLGTQPAVTQTNNTFVVTNALPPPANRTLLNPQGLPPALPNQPTPQTPAANQSQNQSQPPPANQPSANRLTSPPGSRPPAQTPPPVQPPPPPAPK